MPTLTPKNCLAKVSHRETPQKPKTRISEKPRKTAKKGGAATVCVKSPSP